MRYGVVLQKARVKAGEFFFFFFLKIDKYVSYKESY